MLFLITGVAGSIGANFVLDFLGSTNAPIFNLDKLASAQLLNDLASHNN